MPPKYVKAYVKRGKTDASDAAAICEAVTRPSMSFVPIKGLEQQGLSMLHSARSQLIGQRTQLVNAVRGHLSELGIIAERGLLGLTELVAIVRDESDQRLPATARAALVVLVRQIEMVSAEIAALDSTLRKENKASELGPAPGDDPLGRPGNRQRAQGPCHTPTQHLTQGRRPLRWVLPMAPSTSDSSGFLPRQSTQNTRWWSGAF